MARDLILKAAVLRYYGTMKLRYLKLKNWIILSLMGALGLSGCHSVKEATTKGERKQGNSAVEPDRRVRRPRNEIMLLYGVPPVNYSGRVEAEPKEEKEARPNDEMAVMYGVPTMNFRVIGKVVNEKGEPVEGMQVVLLNSDIDHENLEGANPEYLKKYFERSGDTTDKEGNFNVQCTDRPYAYQHVLVRDIDGEKNGSYMEQVIDLEFPKTEVSSRANATGLVKNDVTITVKSK